MWRQRRVRTLVPDDHDGIPLCFCFFFPAGKVIITLNDEKTTPTEVEVPVDLNWTNRSDKRCSAPKAVIAVGVVLVLGLSLVTLFKVQNLVYSTSYINWRMQELESAVGDSNDDVKMIKYKLSLEERAEDFAKAARAEPLILASGKGNSVEPPSDGQDLKISESQNQNHKLNTNSLTSEPEAKNSKEAEVQTANKVEETESKKEEVESKNTKTSEATNLNDAQNHPNPADPEEWIKPLVETFDIFGNQPIEDHFIQNVLMKLLMPENNFEVLEFNKMQEANNAANQEAENQKQQFLSPLMRNTREKMSSKQLPLPIESILMKTLLPPVSNFKIFHFNEKPDQQSQPQIQLLPQQPNMEEEMTPSKVAFHNLKIKQMLPPIEGLVKSLLPPNNMKIFQFNDKQEQSAEEDMPKITIQSIKLKLLPIPQPQMEDFSGRRDSPANNFEVIRLNESPEPSQEVEAPPRGPMPLASFNPFPIPLQDILMKTILPSSKNFEIVPLRQPEEPQQPQQPQQFQSQQFQPHQFQPQQFQPQQFQPQQFQPQQFQPHHFQHQQFQPLPQHMHIHPQHLQSQQQEPESMDQQQEPKFNPLPIPIQDLVMKTLMPPPSQSAEPNHYQEAAVAREQAAAAAAEAAAQGNPEVEVTKVPVRTMKVHQFPLPIPDALMKSMIPLGPGYGEPIINMSEAHEQGDQPQQQQPQEPQQPQEHPQEHPQQEHPQQEQPQPHQISRLMPLARHTKLNPVDVAWNMAPPQYAPQEPGQN